MDTLKRLSFTPRSHEPTGPETSEHDEEIMDVVMAEVNEIDDTKPLPSETTSIASAYPPILFLPPSVLAPIFSHLSSLHGALRKASASSPPSPIVSSFLSQSILPLFSAAEALEKDEKEDGHDVDSDEWWRNVEEAVSSLTTSMQLAFQGAVKVTNERKADGTVKPKQGEGEEEEEVDSFHFLLRQNFFVRLFNSLKTQRIISAITPLLSLLSSPPSLASLQKYPLSPLLHIIGNMMWSYLSLFEVRCHSSSLVPLSLSTLPSLAPLFSLLMIGGSVAVLVLPP